MVEGPALTDEVRRVVERFKERAGIERVFVVGSQVGREAGPHSDVDLLLVDPRFRGEKFFERPVALYDHWPKGIPVDFLCYTPEEFERLKDRPTIVRVAVEEGVAVA